jgi:DNA replication and repair protein RecF
MHKAKQTLLEALYYFTAGRSFRSRADRELINFCRDRAAISAFIRSCDRDQKIEVKNNKRRSRQLFLNDVKLKSAAQLSEN